MLYKVQWYGQWTVLWSGVDSRMSRTVECELMQASVTDFVCGIFISTRLMNMFLNGKH